LLKSILRINLCHKFISDNQISAIIKYLIIEKKRFVRTVLVSSLTRFSYINWTIFAFLCLENILRFALFKGVSYHETLSFEDKVLYHIRI